VLYAQTVFLVMFLALDFLRAPHVRPASLSVPTKPAALSARRARFLLKGLCDALLAPLALFPIPVELENARLVSVVPIQLVEPRPVRFARLVPFRHRQDMLHAWPAALVMPQRQARRFVLSAKRVSSHSLVQVRVQPVLLVRTPRPPGLLRAFRALLVTYLYPDLISVRPVSRDPFFR